MENRDRLKDISMAYIKQNYYLIDTLIINGVTWYLYEDEVYGDEDYMVATDGKIYTYTYEPLEYTVVTLYDEYTVGYVK